MNPKKVFCRFSKNGVNEIAHKKGVVIIWELHTPTNFFTSLRKLFLDIETGEIRYAWEYEDWHAARPMQRTTIRKWLQAFCDDVRHDVVNASFGSGMSL